MSIAFDGVSSHLLPAPSKKPRRLEGGGRRGFEDVELRLRERCASTAEYRHKQTAGLTVLGAGRRGRPRRRRDRRDTHLSRSALALPRTAGWRSSTARQPTHASVLPQDARAHARCASENSPHRREQRRPPPTYFDHPPVCSSSRSTWSRNSIMSSSEC